MVCIFQLFPPHQNPVCIVSHTRATRLAYSIMHHFNILKITKLSLSQPYKTSKITFQFILILMVLDRKWKTKNYGPRISKHSPYFIGYNIIHARNFELFTPFLNIFNLLYVQKFYWLHLCHDFVLHPECYS